MPKSSRRANLVHLPRQAKQCFFDGKNSGKERLLSMMKLMFTRVSMSRKQLSGSEWYAKRQYFFITVSGLCVGKITAPTSSIEQICRGKRLMSKGFTLVALSADRVCSVKI